MGVSLWVCMLGSVAVHLYVRGNGRVRAAMCACVREIVCA